ncbi:MAG: hypothetical protein GX442_20475 [Candidatus Riflebacteria bacterium]|nr:hypothetical protein [Candidatus Riflebacteria bacterium]
MNGRWRQGILFVVLVAALALVTHGLREAWRQETAGVASRSSLQVLASADPDAEPDTDGHAPGGEPGHPPGHDHEPGHEHGPGPGHGHPGNHDHDHDDDHGPGPAGADQPDHDHPAPEPTPPAGHEHVGEGHDHDHGHQHAHAPNAILHELLPGDGPHVHVHGPGCGHAHALADEQTETGGPAISNGLILILEHLGMRELAANLLWIQMDADSHRGLWHRVEFALELIPAIDPHFVEAYLLLAYVQDMNKQFDRSLATLRAGARNNPWRSELPIQIGVQCFNHTGRHGPGRDLPAALDAFTQACRLSDCPGYAFRLRAITLVASGRRDEAIAWLEQVKNMPDRSELDREMDRKLLDRFRKGEEW